MRIITKILSVISILFIISIIFISYNILNQEYDLKNSDSLILEISSNKDKNFLTVEMINVPINWEYITKKGEATKPFGQIEIGDKITNCYGDVELYYGDKTIGSWSFSKDYPDDYYTIQFNGHWSNDYEEYDLRYDNSYKCLIKKEYNEDIPILCGNIDDYGYYDVNRSYQNLFFPDRDSKEEIVAFNYYINENNNKLYLYDWNLTNKTSLCRDVRSIDEELDLYNYQMEKVNITGFFKLNTTENFGYLNYNKSYNDLIVSFKYYNESNTSFFDNKTIQLTGYIFNPDENVIWDKPYVKYIDSIKIKD